MTAIGTGRHGGRRALGGLLAAALTVLARWSWSRHVARTTRAVPPVVGTSDGAFLHVELDGPPDAPVTVVLVHGFAARLEEFDAQRGELRNRARLVLFDQRGHGRSGWSDHQSLTIDRLGLDVGEVVDTTSGTTPVVLVGHSMGGMAVLALADRRPELFGRKVVAVALLSTSAGNVARAVLPRRAARVLIGTGIARAYVWLLWLLAPVADRLHPFRTEPGRRWLRHRMFGRGRIDPEVQDAVEATWSNTSQSMVAGLYRSLVWHDKTKAFRALRAVPTLVVSGMQDSTIPHWHSKRIAEELGPAARLILVPHAGHMVNVTHPHVVNDALLRLLDEAEGENAGSVTAESCPPR
jgi:pimeloyl-ACP methyl ester carboxylesterase